MLTCLSTLSSLQNIQQRKLSQLSVMLHANSIALYIYLTLITFHETSASQSTTRLSVVRNHRNDVIVTRTVVVGSMEECGMSCLQVWSCLSANALRQDGPGGDVTCQLLSEQVDDFTSLEIAYDWSYIYFRELNYHIYAFALICTSVFIM